MSEQLAFILDCLDRSVPISEICRRYGISEKTGYKRLKRFKEDGIDGIYDHRRARLTHPFRIAQDVRQEIISLKRRFRHYGPKTIRDILKQRDPDAHWPAASSIAKSSNRTISFDRRENISLKLTFLWEVEEQNQLNQILCGPLTSKVSFDSEQEATTAIHSL